MKRLLIAGAASAALALSCSGYSDEARPITDSEGKTETVVIHGDTWLRVVVDGRNCLYYPGAGHRGPALECDGS